MVELIPNHDQDGTIGPALEAYRSTAPQAFVPLPVATVVAAARARRRRRLATGLVAGAVTLAAAGGVVVGRAVLAGPPQPAGRAAAGASTSSDPSVPAEVPAATQTPDPSPSAGPDLTKVDWPNATVVLPSHETCPRGLARFQRGIAKSGERREISLTLGGEPAFGDLTGDGTAEAVLSIVCAPLTRDQVPATQLLAVTGSHRGLMGIGYAGPVGAVYERSAVEKQRIVAWVHPQYAAYSPSQRRTYRFTGDGFAQDAGLTRFPDVRQSTLRMPAVVDCAAGSANFRHGAATVGAASYLIDETVGVGKHTDLDGDGTQEMVLPIRCSPPTGPDTSALYVLGQTANGFAVLDVPCSGVAFEEFDVKAPYLMVRVSGRSHRMTWNGKAFTPRIGSFSWP